MRKNVEIHKELIDQNIKYKTDLLLKWMRGDEQPPCKIIYFPTNKCNLECRICWQRLGVYDYSELSQSRVEKLIEEAKKLKVREFVIGGGGESLIRFDKFKTMFQKIKKLGMYGLIFTNGTLLTEEKSSFFVKINWDKILFSLDSSDAKINDFIRDIGVYSKVTKNIDKLVHIKQQRKSYFPIIGLSIVITSKNYHQIKDIVEFCKENGIEQINLIRHVVYLPEQNVFSMNDSDLATFRILLKEAKKISDNYGIINNFANYIKSPRISNFQLKNRNIFLNSLCFEPFYNIVIHPNGNVGPCCMFEDDFIGNIKDSSLEEVWFNEKFNQLRSQILERKYQSYCKICDRNVHCENESLRQKLSREA